MLRGHYWGGSFSGSHNGRISLRLIGEGSKLTGLAYMDSDKGTYLYSLTGSANEGDIEFVGEPQSEIVPGALASFIIQHLVAKFAKPSGQLTVSGRVAEVPFGPGPPSLMILGNWKTADGCFGTFQAVKRNDR